MKVANPDTASHAEVTEFEPFAAPGRDPLDQQGISFGITGKGTVLYTPSQTWRLRMPSNQYSTCPDQAAAQRAVIGAYIARNYGSSAKCAHAITQHQGGRLVARRTVEGWRSGKPIPYAMAVLLRTCHD